MSRLTHAMVTLLLIAVPVSADMSKALDIVPHDTLGFILINNLSQLSTNVDNLAKKLKVEEYRSLLDLIHKEMGIGEGLDEKGSALILAIKGKKENSLRQPIFALPVSDPAKMLAQLGVKNSKERISKGDVAPQSGILFSIGGRESDDKILKRFPILVARKGDFVLLASLEDRDALEQILDSKQSIVASLEPARKWLDEQDICGVCSQHGVKFGIAMMLSGPNGMLGSSTSGQLANMKSTFADMEKNVKLIAFGSRIEKEGHARLLTRVYFEPKGSYAAWMAKAQPLVGDILSRMSDQPYIVAAIARVSAQTNFDGLRQVLPEKMPAEEANNLLEKYRLVMKRISEAGLLVYKDEADAKSTAKDAKDDTRIAFLAKVDDAPAFVQETMQALLQTHLAMQKYDACMVEVKTEQKRIADKQSWLITVRTPNAEKKGDSKETTGYTEQTILLTEIDAQTVLGAVLAHGAGAESLVKSYSQKQAQPLSANRGVMSTAALLPKDLQVAVYVNMAAVMTSKKDTPPLAFAMRTLPAGAEAQFLVPFEALQAMFDASRGEKKEKKAK